MCACDIETLEALIERSLCDTTALRYGDRSNRPHNAMGDMQIRLDKGLWIVKGLRLAALLVEIRSTVTNKISIWKIEISRLDCNGFEYLKTNPK